MLEVPETLVFKARQIVELTSGLVAIDSLVQVEGQGHQLF